MTSVGSAQTEAVERLEATLATMARLERYRGHFYNWYDTATDLRPLEPRYVSSVDSGNLAGHLIALAGACREWRSDSPTAEVRSPQQASRRPRLGAKSGERALAGPGARLVSRTGPTRPGALKAAETGRWASLGLEAERVADAARALAIEEGDDERRATRSTGPRRRGAPLKATPAMPPPARGTPRRSRLAALEECARRWRWRWTSASCSIPTACCFRSATRPHEGSRDPELLRPAGVGGAARQLRGDRQGRRRRRATGSGSGAR